MVLSKKGVARPITGAYATGSAFPTLKLKPRLGRLLTWQDDEPSALSNGVAAVISEDFWLEHFGGDPGVLGQPITVDGGTATIVGVMPRSFNGITVDYSPQVVLPFIFDVALHGKSSCRFRSDCTWFFTMARLKPGVTFAQAQANLAAIAGDVLKESLTEGYQRIDYLRNGTLSLIPGRTGSSPLGKVYGRELWTLQTLVGLLSSANLASRRWAFEQYDCIVGSRTVRRPEAADAAVLLLEGGTALSVSIDGNGRRVAVDPYRGAVEAVLECSANLACTGAEPLGLTNCLNFGNPEKPHIAWQLTEAVRGLGDACRALGVPVVGGNVSLYNEGAEGPIYPTPVVGMVGELPDVERAGRLGFVNEGDAIAIVGPFNPDLHGSELAKLGGGELPRGLPDFDLDAMALAECCLAGGIGAAVDFGAPADDALLFGEAPGAFVVSGDWEALARFGSAVRVIGRVGGDALAIEGVLSVPLSELSAAHTGGLADLLR